MAVNLNKEEPKNIVDIITEDHNERAYNAYHGASGYSGHSGMWSKMPSPQFKQTQICLKLNNDRSYQDTINEYLKAGYTFVHQIYVAEGNCPIIILQLPKY